MRRATWLLFASTLLLVQRIHVSRAQRTHARQGLNRESPTVTIPSQGSVLGKEVAVSNSLRLTQYLGIPYAQPPIGNLRFARPVTDPLPSWNGVKNATQFAPSCQQASIQLKLHEKLYKRLLPPDVPDPGFNEDCLFLNIFVPNEGNRQNDQWPVMVWFHSGDFNTGTPAIWDASIFVSKQKVLVVTVAYRLNILGFFTTTDTEASGNYGMFDQIAALDWVKRNIKYFNGSPNNIVIYGHSSGAISVGLHMLSPLSRGKFHKAIAMSGDAISSVGTLDRERPVVDIIAERFGCDRRSPELMVCLRRLQADYLIEHTSDIETWGPIVDAETNNETEPFLAQPPKDILENGNFNAVPLITGYTNNEQVLAYMETTSSQNPEGGLSSENFETMITEEFTAAVQNADDNSTCESKPEMVTNAVLFFYRPYPSTENMTIFRDRYLDLQTEKNYAAGLTLLAGKVAKQKKTTAFVYRFDYRPKTQPVAKDVPEWAGVPHMFELPFVWGLPHLMGAGTTQWIFNDKKMSDVMMAMLATFAKTGDPSLTSATGSIKWEPYTQENPRILIIDKNIEMNEPDAVDYKALAFWNEYYPQVVTEATNKCCNITNTATTWRIFSRSVCLSGVMATVTFHRFWFSNYGHSVKY